MERREGNPTVQSSALSPFLDIVYLKLNGRPPLSMVPDEYVIEEIVPVANFTAFEGNVSGAALSGRLNGTGLRFDETTRCFSCLLNFAEKGTSGAVMFADTTVENQVQAIGCFKGSMPVRQGAHMRGIIVPFPEWGEISWVECKNQPTLFKGANACLDGEHSLKGPLRRDGCPMFLIIQHCKEYDFRQGDAAFDGNEGDDEDY